MRIDPKAFREAYDMLTLPVLAGAVVCFFGLGVLVCMDVWVL